MHQVVPLSKVRLASPLCPTLAFLRGYLRLATRLFVWPVPLLCSGRETKSNICLRSQHLLTTKQRRLFLWALSAYFRPDLVSLQLLLEAASRRSSFISPTRFTLLAPLPPLTPLAPSNCRGDC